MVYKIENKLVIVDLGNQNKYKMLKPDQVIIAPL